MLKKGNPLLQSIVSECVREFGPLQAHVWNTKEIGCISLFVFFTVASVGRWLPQVGRGLTVIFCLMNQTAARCKARATGLAVHQVNTGWLILCHSSCDACPLQHLSEICYHPTHELQTPKGLWISGMKDVWKMCVLYLGCLKSGIPLKTPNGTKMVSSAFLHDHEIHYLDVNDFYMVVTSRLFR